MLDVPTLAVPVAAAAGGAIAIWATLERLYVPIPPNRALVLFGRRAAPASRTGGPAAANASAREPRILIGGGTFIAPWNRAFAYLSLAPVDLESTVRALHALEGTAAAGWEVALRVQVKVPAEPRAVRAAAENLLGLGEEELRAYVRRAVEGAVPTILARLRPGDAEPDWEHLASEIHAAVAPDLVTAGLVVRSVAVTELHRIAPAGRGDRTLDPRRRAPAPAAGADAEPRLARVELGLRAIAADLARLLRDQPGRSADPDRWPDAPGPDRSDEPTHDSIADGRTPPARSPWGSPPDAEANP